VGCDDEPTEPTGNNEGVVYVLEWDRDTTDLALVKFDAANGARLGTYPVKDYKRDELVAVGVNRRNGDVYLAFLRGFVRMGSEGQVYFDRDFWLNSIYADTRVLVDAGANRVWVNDGDSYDLHDAETGDLLTTVTPIGKGAISEYDHTMVAAASREFATELVKLSKDGEELWRREVSTERRTCVCMAVDPADGAIYIFSDNEREPLRNFYLQKLTRDGEVIFDEEIPRRYGTHTEVSVLDGTIWATGGHAFHIDADGRVIKELGDKYYYALALSRLSNKVLLTATDPNRLILAVDTETYRKVWSVRLDYVTGFVGWANAQ
jgi:outer membrane protein assembly factor BamB